MSAERDRCICLLRIEYSETSQILLLFGREHGTVRVIARGAHRKTRAGASKFGGGIDLLDLGEAVFIRRPEQNLGTLTEWELADGHLELRRSLRGLYLAQYSAELVAHLIEEHDPHPELFDRLERTLGELATPRVEQSFVAFELDLLRQTGYLPQLSACAACGSVPEVDEAVGFSVARSGVVCRKCGDGTPDVRPLDRRLLAVMRYLATLPPGQALPALTRAQADPINVLLADHIQHTLGKPLRLPRYVLPAEV